MNQPRNRLSGYTPPPPPPTQAAKQPVFRPESATPGLPADKWQRRRKAPQRETRVGISPLELLGRRAIGGDEQGEAFVEELTHCLARRVEERRRRLLHPLGTGPRMLGQNLRHAERVGSRPLPSRGGPLFDFQAPLRDPAEREGCQPPG